MILPIHSCYSVEIITSIYPFQVEQSRRERDELSHELRKRDQEVEKVHQDKLIELEKVYCAAQ